MVLPVRSKNLCGIAVILQQAAKALAATYSAFGLVLADLTQGNRSVLPFPWWFLSV